MDCALLLVVCINFRGSYGMGEVIQNLYVTLNFRRQIQNKEYDAIFVIINEQHIIYGYIK